MNPRSYRIELYGIVNKCSFNKCLDTCPLKKLRLLPLKERLQWAKGLSDEKVIEFISEHEKCYSQRRSNNEIPEALI